MVSFCIGDRVCEDDFSQGIPIEKEIKKIK
jgi:hypothetical protein